MTQNSKAHFLWDSSVIKLVESEKRAWWRPKETRGIVWVDRGVRVRKCRCRCSVADISRHEPSESPSTLASIGETRFSKHNATVNLLRTTTHGPGPFRSYGAMWFKSQE